MEKITIKENVNQKMDWKQAIDWAIKLAPTIWDMYKRFQDRKYKPRH